MVMAATDTVTVVMETVRAAIRTVKAADLPEHRLVRATRTAIRTETDRAEDSRTATVRAEASRETGRAADSRTAMVRAEDLTVDQDSVAVSRADSAWAAAQARQFLL